MLKNCMLKNIVKIFGASALLCCLFNINNINAEDAIQSSGMKLRLNADATMTKSNNEKITFLDKNDSSVFSVSNYKSLKNPAASIALNYELNGFEYGVEAGYRMFDFKDKESNNSKKILENSIYTLMANVNYSLNLDSKFSPYVGVAAGLAHVNIKAPTKSIEFSKNTFAGAFRTGVSYNFNDSVSASLGYKAFAIKEIKGEDELNDAKGFTKINGDIKNLSHGVEFGLAFKI